MVAAQDETEARQSFLAQSAEASTFLGLLSFPQLLEERPIQMKVFRSLSSGNQTIFRAAIELCLKAPQLEEMPSIKRRFDNAFVGYNPTKKQAILELAQENEAFLQDLRVISLISDALRNEQLQELAVTIVKQEQRLKENPAIAEALMNLPGSPIEVDTKLPSFDIFTENVEAIFQKLGPEEKSCIDCHKSHPILRLRPVEGGRAGERIQEHYRNTLRVLDLKEPENSLLLLKPTLPAPPPGTLIHTGDRTNHSGDTHWGKGSPSYQTLLDWIRTAQQ